MLPTAPDTGQPASGSSASGDPVRPRAPDGGRMRWARHLAWLPVPVFVALFVALYGHDNLAFEPRFLLPALNIVFLTGVSLLVAYLAARSYVWGESHAVLLLGCGMLALGVASAMSAFGVLLDTGQNFTVTTHNIGACLAAAFSVASAYVAAPASRSDTTDRVVRRARARIVLAYAAIVLFLALVAVAAIDGALPDFFVPRQGPTLVRQIVLGAAVAMFLLSAVVFRVLGRRSSSAFLSWYSLALVLIAIGLTQVFTQHAVGSALSWLGRTAQYLGCVYMYVAVLSVPAAGGRPWGIPLDQILEETRDRHRSLVDLSPDAILVHDGERYVFANPAAATLFGARTPDDLVGKGVLDLTHPDDRETISRRIGIVRGGGTTPLREARLLRLDGSEVDVEATASLVTFRGRPAVQVVIRDVTERKRAETELRESERRYRALFQNMAEGFFSAQVICDDKGKPIDYRYLDANDAFDRLTGLKRGQIVGRTVREVLPDVQDVWIETYGRVALTGEPARIEEFAVPLGRTYRTVAYSLGGGRFACLFEDVSERKAAEERLRNSERLYRAIGESIDYGVWVCDPDGRNIYASDSFLKLVGLTQEECSNFGWGSVLHPDDAARTLAAWTECVRTEGTWDIEHRFKGVDGRWHAVLARGVPVRNEAGQILCWAGINLDISRMKQAEEALRETDRRKNEFLATLSHELRNPLAPIRYALELLERDPAARRPRHVIERQLTHLVRLVDDLLDMTRIESNKIQLRAERVDMASIVRHAAEAAAPDIEQARHTLAVLLPPQPIWVDGDPHRLAQVVTNVLNNAARYTPNGGKIDLSVTADERDVIITVSDTGIGFRPEDTERMFEMFTQLGEPGRGGLGIGLALVKGIVELHGGTVSAASEGPGRGSQSRISLPRAKVLSTAGATEAASRPPAGRLRILVVDDNEDALEMLRFFLETSGHDVRGGRDAVSALATLGDFRADVGLFDIGLPGIDGYELARRVRQDPSTASMYLIAVTGWGQESDRQRARESGFDAHVTKPANPDEITRLLANVRPAARG